MNCKPGDLAIVVKVLDPQDAWGLGCVVRCIELVSIEGDWCWRLEDYLDEPNGGDCWLYIDDEMLRPIGNPGEDARDETLDWLPVPTMEIA